MLPGTKMSPSTRMGNSLSHQLMFTWGPVRGINWGDVYCPLEWSPECLQVQLESAFSLDGSTYVHNISQCFSYVVSDAMRNLSLKLVRAVRAQAHP